MSGRYGNDGGWGREERWRAREERAGRRDPWWVHEQNPAQGFSAWRGDASDREWHERHGTYGAGRDEPRGQWSRGPDHPDFDRDYAQDFGGAYGYRRDKPWSQSHRTGQYGRPYSARDWRHFRGGGYDRFDELGRPDGYDAFSRDWDYAGYGIRRHDGPEGRRTGRYAGIGPKGYRRSDERIREDINDLLTADPDIDASEIDVRVANGVVTLSGVVEDRAAKRLAEDLAEDVLGVDDIDNRLKVRRGFLAGLTGERTSERELSREPAKEHTAATSATGARRSRTNA